MLNIWRVTWAKGEHDMWSEQCITLKEPVKGCFKEWVYWETTNFKYWLNIRSSGQTTRKIPFALREPMEQEVNKSVKASIIKRLEGPSQWISPVNLVNKGRKWRLTANMRKVKNKIQRGLHLTPTLAELLLKLNSNDSFYLWLYSPCGPWPLF
jgi:hypothetical protein